MRHGEDESLSTSTIPGPARPSTRVGPGAGEHHG